MDKYIYTRLLRSAYLHASRLLGVFSFMAEYRNGDRYEVGYECDPVEASSSDSLKCGICHHVLRDAQQTKCCGHCFCKKCIEKVLQSTVIDKKCPCCNEKVLNVVDDKRTQRQVLNLKVCCPNKQLGGCMWTGELRLFEKHLGDDCPFTEVQCSNGCHQMIQRRMLENHLKSECGLRQVICESCNITGPFQWVTGEHQLKECVDFKLNYYKQQLAKTQEELETVKQKFAELQQKFECTNNMDKKKLSAFHALDWPTQLSCLAAEDSPGLPTIIKMPQFSKSNQDGWSSPSFMTHEGGYKMFMKVYANGYIHNEGHGKFISVALFLMKGEHDERLIWPMKGTMTIQLLNVLADEDHSPAVEFKFNGRDEKMCLVRDGVCAERASWAHKFIALDNLSYNQHQKHQYLKDNCIYLRVRSFLYDK